MLTFETVKSYKVSLGWILFLVLSDAVLTGMLAFSVWTLLVNLVFRLPYNSFQFLVRNQHAGLTIKRCILLAVASVLTIAYCGFLHQIALDNASKVSQSIEAFKQDRGNYPPDLNSLVPKYLSEIPRSKPVLFPPRFRYSLAANGPSLSFGPSLLPRPIGYDFTTKRWRVVD